MQILKKNPMISERDEICSVQVITAFLKTLKKSAIKSKIQALTFHGEKGPELHYRHQDFLTKADFPVF
jgi:hypothetical protein